eukprot:6098249-Alexandrium_andersonii.AAC.1
MWDRRAWSRHPMWLLWCMWGPFHAGSSERGTARSGKKLTERAAFHLVRPLGNETNPVHMETTVDLDHEIVTSALLAIED